MEDRRRFYKRNETALLWQGIIFTAGLCYIDANAVLPVFVSSMGGSLALAGLVNAIHVVPSILGQFFVGVQSGRIRNLPRYITAVMSVAYFLPAVGGIVLFSGAGPSASLAVVLALYGLLWAGDGSVAIGWFDLFGRAADPRRRGMIMAWQLLFGGILALGGSSVVRIVLGAEGLPVTYRYAILFCMAGLIMAGSAVPMSFVRDAPHRVVTHEGLRSHLSSFPALFRASPIFRHMTAVQALQGIATMALPILVLFSGRTFSLSLAATAWLVTAQMAGSLSGGLVWGFVSHRLGNSRIIQLNQCNILTIMALATVASFTGAAWLAFPLAFLAGITFSSWLGYPNYIIDTMDEAKRPQYLVMSSLVGLPFTLMPWVAGMLAERFGFVPVFLLCIAAATASLTLSFGLRHKKLAEKIENE